MIQKLQCSIKRVLLRRKPYFSVTSVTLCSVWLPWLQLVLSIMPLILRDFIKIIRYTGACSIFSAFQRRCKATQTFEICTWHFFLEKLSVFYALEKKNLLGSLSPDAWRRNKLLRSGDVYLFFHLCKSTYEMYIQFIH